MIATQLFYGPREKKAFSLDELDAAIRRARDAAGVRLIMTWPCPDISDTERILRSCRAAGVEPWLWFPVLADTPGVVVSPGEMVTAFDGSRGNGKTCAWTGLKTAQPGEENFLFACPNREPFVDRALGAFCALLDRLDVDGVMLDRIRFPSPANGFEMLFSCFCDACAARFASETGARLSTLADRAAAFVKKLERLDARSFQSGWRDTDTLWTVSGCADLAGFRERSISRVVERFCREARSRGRKICLDLFSPSLAGIVGQDYRILAGMADFVKPMIYRHARGPAGFPLEVGCLRDALRAIAPGLSEADAAGVVGAALRMDASAPAAFPPELVSRELDLLEGRKLSASVRVLAGVEAVRMPELRIDITEEILTENLSRTAGRVHGVAASWNLLYIPEANLRRIGELTRKGTS